MALRALQKRLGELETEHSTLSAEEELHRRLLKNARDHQHHQRLTAKALKAVGSAFVRSTAIKTSKQFELTECEFNAHRNLLSEYVPEGEGSNYRFGWRERLNTAPSLYIDCDDGLFSRAKKSAIVKQQVLRVVPRVEVQREEEGYALTSYRRREANNVAAKTEHQRIKDKLAKLERPKTAAARVTSMRPATAAASAERSTSPQLEKGGDIQAEEGRPERPPSARERRVLTAQGTPPPKRISRPSTATTRVNTRPMTAASLRRKICRLEDPAIPLREHFPDPEYAPLDLDAALDQRVDGIVEKGDLVESTFAHTRFSSATDHHHQPEFNIHARTSTGNAFAFDMLQSTEADLEKALREAEAKLEAYHQKRAGLFLRNRCALAIQKWWRAFPRAYVDEEGMVLPEELQ